jgi:Alpha/beta hydrolase domain
MIIRIAALSSLAILTGLGATQPASARITQIVINSRVPAYGGVAFPNTGAYEQLDGTAYYEVDADDPLNRVITDIKLAPRNARGNVEFSADISILKPVDMSKSNGVLLYEDVNRGNKNTPSFNIGGSVTAPGDGFLESRGYTMAWAGWEGDITGGVKINLPIAHDRNGSTITGRVRAEYILNAAASTVDVTAPPAYEAVSTNNFGATLTMRVHQTDPRVLIPNSQWGFADCSSTPFPGTPSTLKVCLQGGFDTNHIYELVYTAKNPTVTGLGFAASRDFVSFLRNNDKRRDRDCDIPEHDHGKRGDRGHGSSPAIVNPLGDAIKHTLIYGSSQSGRWIRTLIELGMNEDEGGRRVIDGAIPHKSSNRGAFNIRFAQPTRLSGTQHTEQQYPGAESPQTFEVSFDPVSGIHAGQLERCRRSKTCPKITHTNSDTEWWQAVMSLDTTDSSGRFDLPVAPEVRIYQFAGTQHGGGDPLNQPPAVLPGFPVACQLRSNSNPFLWEQRALLEALREWVETGREPPPSAYSTLGNHSLVKPSEVHYPFIPAVNFTVPGITNFKFYLDRGPRFDVEDISGIMNEPPIPRGSYTVLVPQVDADGNTADGIRNTNVQVPLGTYLGWNVRKAGFSEGDSCDLTGGFVPFFQTKAQRLAVGDARPSLEERYPTHKVYVDKVTAAANSLVQQRFLLPEDATSIIAAANAAAVP